jgi:hypothetical protein
LVIAVLVSDGTFSHFFFVVFVTHFVGESEDGEEGGGSEGKKVGEVHVEGGVGVIDGYW